MKKYLIILLAAAISFAAISCGSGTKKQEQAPTQSSANETKVSGATPANMNDLLEYYTGTFEGIIPCADCEGIDVKLTLNKDYTYSQTMEYKGKNNIFETIGKWKINESLNIIAIGFDDPNVVTLYKIVNVNTLQMLDKEGKEINSSLNYYLTR